MSTQHTAVFQGRKVSDQEYWRLRLQQIIDGGVTPDDLQSLGEDLSFENFTGDDELIQVPCMILQIPLYHEVGGKIVPLTSDETDELFNRVPDNLTVLDNLKVQDIVQGITYVK